MSDVCPRDVYISKPLCIETCSQRARRELTTRQRRLLQQHFDVGDFSHKKNGWQTGPAERVKLPLLLNVEKEEEEVEVESDGLRKGRSYTDLVRGGEKTRMMGGRSGWSASDAGPGRLKVGASDRSEMK